MDVVENIISLIQKLCLRFDLISSLVENSITKKKKKLAKIVCFLLSCIRFESELRRTSLQQRLMRPVFSDCTVPAVPQTRLNSVCGTSDKTQVP